MRRITLLALLGLFIAACSDPASREPTAPGFAFSVAPSCPSAPQISVQIGKLFPLGGGLIIAQVTFDVIVLKKRLGRTVEAQTLTRGLIDFTTGRFDAGVLFGRRSPATLTKVVTLTNSLQCFVGLPQAIPPGATDVAAAVVSETTATVVTTPAAQAGIRINPGDVSQPTLVTVYAPAETLLTNLDKYGPFYQFTASTTQFNSPVLLGTCPTGVPPEAASLLRLAHNVPDPHPTGIEILPFADPTPLQLACSTALGPTSESRNLALRALQRLGRRVTTLLAPDPLSAAVIGGGTGGTTKHFSLFGAVNPQVVKFQAQGYDYLPLTPSTGSADTTGWEAAAFTPPPAWSTSGQAAFSSGDAAPFPACGLSATIHTPWALNSDLLVRKRFVAPLGTTKVSIQVAIDNDVQVFVNGHDITATATAPELGGFATHEGCAELNNAAFVFTAEGFLNLGGDNVIAVRSRDRGVMSYLDLKALLVTP